MEPQPTHEYLSIGELDAAIEKRSQRLQEIAAAIAQLRETLSIDAEIRVLERIERQAQMTNMAARKQRTHYQQARLAELWVKLNAMQAMRKQSS